MTTVCKICSPFVPGLTGLKDTKKAPRSTPDEAAVRERVDNTRVSILRSPGHGPRRTRAAFEIMKLWENGRKLRCKFIDGQSDVQAKVEAIAKEWEQFANLKLQFITSGAAEIRISFLEKGFSWSTMGTDALTVGASEATMMYGWLEPNTPLREYQRVVRHEFGHAIGLIHEHQNPAAQGQIPWDKPKVYAHYARQGWDKQDTDFNIFDVYAEDSTNHTSFDRDSIMQYAVPDELTVGSFAIGWNTELSPVDKEWTKKQYPKGAPAVTPLTVGGPPTPTDLSTGGEVDSFSFSIGTAATYIMNTSGSTDTVMTLHGPNDPGAVLAFDDDRGAGANARIVRKLQRGDYWLTVRHKQPTGTGSYSIGVKKRA
jgi:hypothetical protein